MRDEIDGWQGARQAGRHACIEIEMTGSCARPPAAGRRPALAVSPPITPSLSTCRVPIISRVPFHNKIEGQHRTQKNKISTLAGRFGLKKVWRAEIIIYGHHLVVLK